MRVSDTFNKIVLFPQLLNAGMRFSRNRENCCKIRQIHHTRSSTEILYLSVTYHHVVIVLPNIYHATKWKILISYRKHVKSTGEFMPICMHKRDVDLRNRE